MQRLIRKLTVFSGNGETFMQTWIPSSLIGFVLSDLDTFVTKYHWHESTIPCAYSLFLMHAR